MLFGKPFRSRWHTLIWAAGILWFAYDIAESPPGAAPPGNDGNSATAEAEAAAAMATLNQVLAAQ